MKRHLIGLLPVPEYLVAATSLYQSGDGIEIIGRDRIELVMKRLAAEASRTCQQFASMDILTSSVLQPGTVRTCLTTLTKRGLKIRWFAPKDSYGVRDACEGVDGVKLLEGTTLPMAIYKNVVRIKADWKIPDELTDYLRFKVARALMMNFSSAPLCDALDKLREHYIEGKPISQAIASEKLALQNFCHAGEPFLEGISEPMQKLKERILQVAETNMTVLVTGETGTGKEAVAYFLHEFSKRRNGPLVAINCAGLDETFLRAELFGHTKGAFTGAQSERRGLVEEAHGGTLFLDELAEMPPVCQAEILRFLQTRRFRRMGEDHERTAEVRVVAATQPRLFTMTRKGDFREDLYFRLSEIEIQTVPLRQMPEDILRVARNIIYRMADLGFSSQLQDQTIRYFEEGEKVFRQYSWPGNSRELARYVKRRLSLGDDVLAEVQNRIASAKTADSSSEGKTEAFTLRTTEEVLTEYIARAWNNRHDLTQKQLAARLGLSINTMKGYLRKASPA